MNSTKITYANQLHPWCIVRSRSVSERESLPQAKSVTLARFRRRGDAEMHLQVLQRQVPNVMFSIVFDVEGRSHSD